MNVDETGGDCVCSGETSVHSCRLLKPAADARSLTCPVQNGCCLLTRHGSVRNYCWRNRLFNYGSVLDNKMEML